LRSDVWDSEKKYETIELKNSNKTAIHPGSTWRTVLGRTGHQYGRKVWRIRVDNAPYVSFKLQIIEHL
jgi:hypothetical protein